MKPSYNIILNSLYGTGALANSKVYSFDTNILPEGEYEVSFTFLSTLTDTTLQKNGLVYCNLGQSNTYEATTAFANNLSSLSQCIGNIMAGNNTTTGFYFADKTTNHPIYFKSKPRNNPIEVIITEGNETTLLTPLSNYVLTLHLQLL